MELSIVIRGGGEVASAIAHKLYHSHFRVCITEIPQPLSISRGASFSEAIYEGLKEVAGVVARRVDSYEDVACAWMDKKVPLLVDPPAGVVGYLKPDVVIDAIMAKRNTGTKMDDAPFVIGVGAGFCVGKDCHAVVETNNSENLGQVIFEGEAEPNTGIPLEVGQLTWERAMFAPMDGIFVGLLEIGDMVKAGDDIGRVESESVRAQIDGMLRALLRSGLWIKRGTKLGEVDPRRERWLCNVIRPRMRTIAGGVLEAIMMHFNK
jgi:xanthine dehydrogenase accessory factor